MKKPIQKHIVRHSESLRILLVFFVLNFFYLQSMSSQEVTDTVRIDTLNIDAPETKEKKGSIFAGRPGKSLLFSLVVPGAGQIYNKSYLRVPVVWAAVGGLGYLMIHNTKVYQFRRDLYISKIDNSAPPENPPKGEADLLTQSAASVRSNRDSANSAKQQAIVGFALVWLANGVDAFVDAHLKDFDMDEDLSIDFGPRMDDDPYAPISLGVFVQF